MADARKRKRVRLTELRDMSSFTPSHQPEHATTSTGTMTAISPEHLMQSRLSELRTMEQQLKNTAIPIGKQLFQTIPRALRRRSRSHRRVPALLRRFVQDGTGGGLGGQGQGHKRAKKEDGNRRKKRRMKGVEQVSWRMHVWHAKRMKMRSLWPNPTTHTPTHTTHRGWVAWEPKEKSRRRLFKAAHVSSIVHDSSPYTCLLCFHIRPEATDTFPTQLNRVLDPFRTRVPLDIGEMSDQFMFGIDQFPYARIGPVQLLRVSSDKMLCWIHVSIRGYVLEEVMKLEGVDRGVVEDWSGRVMRMEVVGDRAHATLQHLISFDDDDDDASSEQNPAYQNRKKAWRLLKALHSPASLPNGFVLGLDDVRVNRPASNMPARDPSLKLHPEAHPLLLNWPPEYSRCDLWHTMTHGNSSSSSIVIMRSTVSNNGYTLITPAHDGFKWWLSLIYAGCQPAGVREMKLLHFESGRAYFPFDAPLCRAYEDQVRRDAGEFRRWLERRPVRYRPKWKEWYRSEQESDEVWCGAGFILDGMYWDWAVKKYANDRTQLVELLNSRLEGEKKKKKKVVDSLKECLVQVRVEAVKKGVIYANAPIVKGERVIGRVTSGDFALSEGKCIGIGFALLEEVLLPNCSSAHHHHHHQLVQIEKRSGGFVDAKLVK